MTMKPIIKNAIRAVISFSLLIALLFYVDIQKIKTFTPELISPPILIALLAALSQIFLTSLRWQYLLKCVHVVLPLRLVIRTNVIGIIANILLFNVIGGVAARAGLLAQKGVEIHSVLSTSILERVVIVIVLVIMSFAGFISLGLSFHIYNNITFRVIAGVGILIAVALLVANYSAPLLGDRLLWVKKQLVTTWLEIRKQAENGRAVVVTFVLSAASQILLVVVGMACAYSTDSNVSLVGCALVLPLIALLSSLPVSVGGLGLREASAVVLLGTLGISSEQALMISVLISIITLLAACLSFAFDALFELCRRPFRRSVVNRKS